MKRHPLQRIGYALDDFEDNYGGIIILIGIPLLIAAAMFCVR